MDRNKAADLLKEKFPEAVQAIDQFRGETTVTIAPGPLRDIMSFLKENEATCYDLLVDLAGVDWGNASPRFMVVYLLHSTRCNNRLRIKTRLDQGAALDTISDIFKAADWFEREAYDMFGITFRNHPDLRRILLEDDFAGHPLRKDFPLKGHAFEQPFPVCLEEEKGTASDA